MKYKILGLVFVVLGLLGLAGGLANYSTGRPGGEARGESNSQTVEKTLSPVSGALMMFVFPVVGVLAVFAGIGFLVVRKKTIESI